MKILLVVPYQDVEPYILPNLGLGYLASALRNRGHEVVYADCLKESIDASSWAKFLLHSQYDIIGIQMYSYTYSSVKTMLRAAKDILPDVITVVGGPHPNAVPEQTLRDIPEIDYVIHGEGEKALLSLAESGNYKKVEILRNSKIGKKLAKSRFRADPGPNSESRRKVLPRGGVRATLERFQTVSGELKIFRALPSHLMAIS